MIEYLLLNIEYWKNGKKRVLITLLATVACCGCASGRSDRDANIPTPDKSAAVAVNSTPDANRIDAILARLDQKSHEIKTYEAKIIYLIKQPALESETLQSGMLYYVSDEKGSKLRINFTSQRQDDEPSPNYQEEYLFDGVNLTRINYKLKNVEYRQLTDVNKPINAFDLASRYLPIVGFTRADKLREDFEIAVLPIADADKQYDQLLLKTRPQSRYKNDYTQIRFWVDKHTSMPIRMEATSSQEDIFDIRLEDAKVNKSFGKGIFSIAVPADFGKNVIPLEKEQK